MVWALLCLAIFRSSIGWSGGGPRWWWWWLLDIADDPPWVSLYLFITLTRFVLLFPANICFLLTILWLLLTRPLLVLSRYLVVRSSFSFFTADIRSPNLKWNNKDSVMWCTSLKIYENLQLLRYKNFQAKWKNSGNMIF